MFSQTLEYALRAMVTLAKAKEKDISLTNKQLSELTQVPANYLSKVLQQLVKAELINSRRGLNGGLTLNKNPEDVNLLEIVDVISPIQRIHQCPLNLVEHKGGLCKLHHKIDEAMAVVEKSFSECTLKSLLSPSGKEPLCLSKSMNKEFDYKI